MKSPETINIFWFRRDLRLEDNTGLYHALNAGKPVLLLFIFDRIILDDLEDKYDPRVTFIYDQIQRMNAEVASYRSFILVKYGKPMEIFKDLQDQYTIDTVFTNEDYEPYAITRDSSIKDLLNRRSIKFMQLKDQVIFHKEDILNDNQEPYKVFTAYKRRWMDRLHTLQIRYYASGSLLKNLMVGAVQATPELSAIGFRHREFSFPSNTFDIGLIASYDQTRDIPSVDGTTRLGLHFRHGTISIRKAVALAKKHNSAWLNELIWREFYSMILYHFPSVVTESFKLQYDNVEWINDEDHFGKWIEGKTGYPIVDAGMRQLNQSGYMHNRVRMITASFLTKHLLIDWRWGEAYFAKKLLDYDLASNNGGWQWAAGTGTDAQPYFRIFNPYEQTRKFDPEEKYIRTWIPEFQNKKYPEPIIDHKFARQRAIETYKRALN